MVEIEFNYNQNKIIIQGNPNNLFKEIIEKYTNKTNLDINILYFISNGKIINKKDKLENIMSESDKRNKKIQILVYSINSIINNENTNIKISKDIICPVCEELCLYEIKDDKIKLYDCKNGHMIENIKLNEFENYQAIDISQIKCDICKNKNKSNTFNNEFYICCDCKMNLCPLCKSIHNKAHSIINYDNKTYLCNKHNEVLFEYCSDCNVDMCISCSNEHKNHKLIFYQDKLIDIKNLRLKMNEFKITINKLKTNLEKIINEFRQIMENMDIIYKINNNLLSDYEKNKNRNYKLLLNLNYINEYIEYETNIIKNEYDYGYNINKLLNIEELKLNQKNNQNLNSNMNLDMSICNQNNKKLEINSINQTEMNQNINNNNVELNENIENNNNINQNNINQMENQQNNQDNISHNEELIYKPNKEGKVRIFGNYFVKNNKQNCKILYNNKEYELKDYFNDIDENYNNKDDIKIKINGMDNITNIGSMFYNCYTLSSLPDISEWNTSKVTNMSNIFSNCYILTSLPDISKWNTSKVTDMSNMFYYCKTLTSLPDISKWDTSNVTNMSNMFYNCNELSSLPDISKWNTSKVTNMFCMFSYCNALKSLPDLSKWDISNVTNISCMFFNCETLNSLPDISKWNISKVTNISCLFYNCNTLSSLPKIAKWNISSVINMSDMFYNCKKTLNIPSKFKK